MLPIASITSCSKFGRKVLGQSRSAEAANLRSLAVERFDLRFWSPKLSYMTKARKLVEHTHVTNVQRSIDCALFDGDILCR